LVIGFTGLLKLVTQLIIVLSLFHALSFLSLRCFHRLSPGNSQRRRFLSFPVFAGWHLSHNSTLLCYATVVYNEGSSASYASASGRLSATTSDGSVSQLLPVDPRLVCLFRWSSSYSHGTDHTKTLLPAFLLLLRDVIAVTERFLWRSRLATGYVFGDAAWRGVTYSIVACKRCCGHVTSAEPLPQRLYLLSPSLVTTVSSGFTIPALSRHVTIL
jgi:hypothetical protein